MECKLLSNILRRKCQAFSLSAHFHMSIDGTRVVNYAQYASYEVLEATTTKIFSAQEMLPLLDELRKIATPDSREYQVRVILEG